MKTLNNHKLILSAIVFFLSSACVCAYPPDNAAVLYYKAAMHYAPDDEMGKLLEGFSNETSKTDVEKIRKFVDKNRSTIDIVLDAAEVKNCDWGLDFSQGLAMDAAYIGGMRKLVYLVLADTKILIKDGDFETALNRCMSLYRMSRHINDRVTVAYLMSVAVDGKVNSCVMQIMSSMQDMQSLSRLKNRLAEIDSIPFSVKPAVMAERDAMLIFMTPQRLSEGITILRNEATSPSAENEAVFEKILSFDDVAIERNRKYFEDFYSGIVDVFDMPYPQGYASLTELFDKAVKQMNDGNSDATLTFVYMPAMGKVLSIATRLQTHNNAIRTAIELYMIKAKTGKLPEELPPNLPPDLFSGEPFNYERTPDGFILRCQGKEINTDKVYQYEFKVK